MAKSQSADVIAELPFPMKGLDTSEAFVRQPPDTTANAQNVRSFEALPDRQRGASRPGNAKFCVQQISTHSIQDINIGITSTIIGNGNVLRTGNGTNISIDAYNASTNTLSSTAVANTAITAGVPSVGCTDEDSNFYVASATFAGGGGTVTIYKYDTTQTLSWTTVVHTPWTVVTTMDSPTPVGMCAFNGKLYVNINGSGSTTGNSKDGIYRFLTSDGTPVDGSSSAAGSPPTNTVSAASAWVGVSAGIARMPGAGSSSLQTLAAGGNFLGCVGNKSSQLVLQHIALSSGVIVLTTILKSPSRDPIALGSVGNGTLTAAKIVTDQGANFYVLTNPVTGTVATPPSGDYNSLIKVNWAGGIVWQVDAPADSVSAADIAYDTAFFRVGVVGTNLFGTSMSFQAYNASNGSLDLAISGQPTANGTAITAWLGLTSDGTGSWRLRRTGASNDLIVMDANGSERTVETTGRSGGAAGTVMWLVCDGLQVASPTTTPMRSQRQTLGLTVSGGGLYSFNRATRTSIDASFLNSSADRVFSTQVGQLLIYTDGTQYKYYDIQRHTTGTLTASSGQLPVDVNGQTGTILETWRARLCVSGMISDPQNWFFSAVGNPRDWNYNQVPFIETQAVAGSNALAGRCPDKVTGMIPYSDDVLIFLCDHTLWQMTGDPNSGGRIDLVTDAIGGAWGRAWCRDPRGAIYFFSDRGALYTYGNRKPVQVSGSISSTFRDVDTGSNLISMAWDEQCQGLHIFITPLDSTVATTHYWWDYRANAFWPVVFANKNHNPKCCFAYDSDLPDDRVVLFGSWDGYIRNFDLSATKDDGTTITSFVTMGPLLTRELDDMMLLDMQAILSTASAKVDYQVLVGNSPEEAYQSTAVLSGKFNPGRNFNKPIQRSGYAIYVKLQSTDAWAIETLRIKLKTLGSIRRRSA